MKFRLSLIFLLLIIFFKVVIDVRASEIEEEWILPGKICSITKERYDSIELFDLTEEKKVETKNPHYEFRYSIDKSDNKGCSYKLILEIIEYAGDGEGFYNGQKAKKILESILKKKPTHEYRFYYRDDRPHLLDGFELIGVSEPFKLIKKTQANNRTQNINQELIIDAAQNKAKPGNNERTPKEKQSSKKKSPPKEKLAKPTPEKKPAPKEDKLSPKEKQTPKKKSSPIEKSTSIKSPFFKRFPKCKMINENIHIIFSDGYIMNMLPVKAGSFYFGASNREADNAFMKLGVKLDYETPQIKKGMEKFWIAEYELTRGLFLQYLKSYIGKKNNFLNIFIEKWKKVDPVSELQIPVSKLLKEEIEGFINWINDAIWESDKPVGYKFSLPTELEWEYAAKGNIPKLFPWGNGKQNAFKKAVFRAKNGRKYEYALPVGSRPEGKSWSNAQDMSGNVHELCMNDFFDYKDLEAVITKRWKNIKSKETEPLNVCRGGAYNTSLWECRCASRYKIYKDIRFPNVGVRIFFVKR